ncbi:anthranilate phosphoribosyltransferase [Paraliobacillus quinghaiensis]|uniref:Anthranilate phosphoribosyltransferase n=1 Tax=Paraliobacillus quinghaiensis TaxID=470815 RepID=A0A917TQJ5_9BACI|nr:anthranilate phosphoribosyltransferase [Paraliobacillus quinghaiensis]GGM33369.1 anthranilate phosphoribosyltransferase [Paraliobacillus quinghaiensis]
MRQYLEKVTNHEDLTLVEMEEAARVMFAEETSDTEIGAFLTSLKVKGETADEIAGLVNVIREKSLTIPKEIPGVMDNCGTGGDGSQSFNISTTSAFVIAGAGITVAKHGNRSISSKTGSADVLEQLGVSLAMTPEQMQVLLKENGIAFLFAPHVHPALKRMMKVRKELRIPTIFNLIGPLTNPVALTTQLLGIYRRDRLEQMANVLHRLGRKRALILNGSGHMDEASLAGENHLVLLELGELMQFTLHPEEVGLPVYANEAIKGGDAFENAQILRDVLEGKQGAHRDIVLLNAGLAIFANGKVQTVQEGVDLARESIDSGAALAKLDYLINYSNQLKQEV